MSRLPGLLFDLVVVCPCPQCIRLGRSETHCKLNRDEWEEMVHGKRMFCEICSEFVDSGLSSNESGGEKVANRSYEQRNENDTKWLSMPENIEKDVGELSLDNVDDPSQKWPMNATPYIFLSHTGQDGVKEDIARPTHWFLTEVLEVEAFVDDLNAIPGNPSVETLMPPAYKCTYALVILSRSFRERRFCVRELNTFVARLRRKDGIRVVPVLWQINSLKGYHPDVEELSYIASKETVDAADFMIYTLWPKVLRALDHPVISTEILQDHLFQYVDSHRGGANSIPPCLERFAANHVIVRQRLH